MHGDNMKLTKKISNILEANLNESTNAYIGIEDAKGGIKYIYSHWDGYPDGVGKELLDNYTDAKKINSLIKLGDVSILRKSVGKKHDFSADRDMADKKGWTTFLLDNLDPALVQEALLAAYNHALGKV